MLQSLFFNVQYLFVISPFYYHFFCSLLCKDSMLREFDHSNLVHQEFTQSAPLVAEISAYLRKSKLVYQTDNHGLERLQYMNEFPILKELYLKYNCISASEADVERIFSYAGRLFAFASFVSCAVQFFIRIWLIFRCWLGLFILALYHFK